MKNNLKTFVGNVLRDISYKIDMGILRPSIIAVSVTNRCNSKCLTCSLWKDNRRINELPTSMWKNIFSEMKKWYGPFQFSLGGGEPLMRRDIDEIIYHAARIGCHPSIHTNGLLLSKDRISALVDAGLKNVVISLNGIKNETHDYTRGIPGGFDKIMNAIEILNKYKGQIGISIATVLMGYNINEVEDLVLWVERNGLDSIKFQAIFYETGNTSYKECWYKNSPLWFPGTGSFSKTTERLLELKKAGYPVANSEEQLLHFKPYFYDPEKTLPVPCKIGIHGFFIAPNGDVQLCYLLDTIGNLAIVEPRKIWNSKKAKKVRKNIKRCRLNCRLKNCNFTD